MDLVSFCGGFCKFSYSLFNRSSMIVELTVLVCRDGTQIHINFSSFFTLEGFLYDEIELWHKEKEKKIIKKRY